MGVSRISTTFLVDRGIYNLQNNLRMMAKLQEQVASGKNISAPSDDPVSLTQLLRLTTETNQDETFGKNVDEAIAEVGTADVAINSVVNIAHRARELSVQAANGTNNSSQLDAISKEVDSLLNQLISVGNTTYAGRYIFAGFQTNSTPFTTAGMDVLYNGTPAASTYQRDIQIAKNSFVPVNVNGEDLLGFVNVAVGPPPVPAGQGLVYDLTKLKLDLQTVPTDFNAIRNNIDLIKTDQQAVLALQTQLGGRANQLEMTRNRIKDRQIVQAQEIAKIQEVDMPKAISTLNFQQNIYQASLGVMSKIMETSLANFLR